ncbi:cuticle protein 21-like [Schistocerca nitens]|uniref:cuticle protein 21-like n=1 Tax=Schistocerca nitens TaxID=7011 RepID=UPI002117BF68|nr:cuticle protein 21-like [Schistocerca nitens]
MNAIPTAPWLRSSDFTNWTRKSPSSAAAGFLAPAVASPGPPLAFIPHPHPAFKVAPAFTLGSGKTLYASAPSAGGQGAGGQQGGSGGQQGGSGGQQGQGQGQGQGRQGGGGPQYVVPGAVPGQDVDFDPHPQYSYAYDVQDTLTGDNKAQQESRDGDNVQGSYSLVEADGSRRTVEYTADPVNGFNAVVHREGAVEGGRAAVAQPQGPGLKLHAFQAPAVASPLVGRG